MMGPRQEAQAALFYEFSLEDHIPQDHLLRSIDRFVDLSSIRAHLSDFYSHTGRPSVDPELLIVESGRGAPCCRCGELLFSGGFRPLSVPQSSPWPRFLIPAHQTGRAVFPHPAFRQVMPGLIGRFVRRITLSGNISRTHSRSPVFGWPDVQWSRNFALCGPGMPVEVAGEDDVAPSEGRRVGKQLGVVERTGLCKMAGCFVHVNCVPKRDGGNDAVERHCPFLLSRVGAIMNAPLRVGKDGPGQ